MRNTHPADCNAMGVALVTCLALAGCGDAAPTGAVNASSGAKAVVPPAIIPGSVTSVRLASLLPRATVTSPLTGIPAARAIEDLEDVESRIVYAEGFEETRDFTAGPWASLRKTDSGRALLFQWGGRWGSPQKLQVHVLPAEPSTHYVFERRVRAGSLPTADFAVVEAMAEAPGTDKNRLGGGGWGRALAMHWPTPPEPDGSWQRGQVTFFTTANTRAIQIEFRPTLGIAGPTHGIHEAWFDDLRLRRVDPTPQQEIALFKARSLAPGAAVDPGIEKFGQFPPRFDVNDAHGPEDDNFSYRYALYAPPPTDLGFDLMVPDRAVLRFSVSLSRETLPGHAARFEVIVRAPPSSPEGEPGPEKVGVEQTEWARTLTARREEWRWHEHVVNLSDYAGQKVTLLLRTRAEQGDPHPVWGNPILDVPPAAGQLRHVILIAVDTLRADRMSCYGYGKKTTPHVDSLCADGVRFEQVASNANWTCPSFASIFTGVTMSRHGVTGQGFATPLPSSFVTLAERFRRAGWLTHSIAYKPPLYDGGYERGFDVFFNVPKDVVRAVDNLAEAMEWLEDNGDRRGFLFLHFNDPHQPFTQPEPYDRTFSSNPAENGMKMPYSVYKKPIKDPARRRIASALYDGEVLYADKCIGDFIAALKKRGLYDDAVIAFVSDHGEQLWEHGAFGHSGNMLWDEVVRIPMIIKPSRGSYARGKTVPTQVRGFDVMPTLLDLAGIEVENRADLDAESLLPLLAEGGAEAADRPAVIECSKKAIAVRTAKWKYILDWGVNSDEMLFDLSSDPGERTNVAAEAPERLMEFRLRALDFILSTRPGHYLVATSADPDGGLEFTVDGVGRMTPFVGLRPRRVGPRKFRFEGAATGPLVAVTALVPAGALVLGTERVSGESSPYRGGDLERLVREGRPGLHLFRGPPAREDAREARRHVDPRVLEALKALGYIK